MNINNHKKPKSIDLFAGAGGLTEGLRNAGFNTVLANEFDAMAGKTYKYNHPSIPLILQDIRNCSIAEMLAEANISDNDISLIAGGPPCQGFSLAGRRLSSDPRNNLFKEFVRVVKGIHPEAFLFENVSGIKSMNSGKVLNAIVAEFESIGYKCEYKVLNCADYGLPQARPRFILLGSRDGRLLGFPRATHTSNQLNDCLFSDNLKQYISVWDAISDLPRITQGEGADQAMHSDNYHNQYQESRRGVRNPGIIFNHKATRHSEIIIERYTAMPEGGNVLTIPARLRTKKNNVYKLDSSRPSRTVTCNHRTDLIHPKIPRGITVREAARLQGFDDDYRFFGNLTRKAKWATQDDQVGNAVPPLLAEVIGNHLRDKLGW